MTGYVDMLVSCSQIIKSQGQIVLTHNFIQLLKRQHNYKQKNES